MYDKNRKDKLRLYYIQGIVEDIHIEYEIIEERFG